MEEASSWNATIADTGCRVAAPILAAGPASQRSSRPRCAAVPRAVKRLGELLDSTDERIQLEAAKAILDRHLGRPAIQADINLSRGVADGHLAALLEMARKRRAEPIDLDEREIVDITPCQSGSK